MRRFGFLVQQSNRSFYQNVSAALEKAATGRSDTRIELRVEFMDDLSPEAVSARMLALGGQVDALGVVITG